MTDDDKSLPNKKEDNDRLPPQNIPYDEVPSENQEDVDRIPPNCRFPCSETRLFEETKEVLLFNKKNYKFSISVNLMGNMMHLINVFFSTGAGPNLTSEDFITAEWLKSIRAGGQPALKHTSNQTDSGVVLITLHVKMGECIVRVIPALYINLQYQSS